MANGKTTGRDAIAYSLAKGTVITGITGALAKGVWYYVLARDTSSLIPAGPSVGRAFLCSLAVAALAAGDSVVPLTPSLLGFVRDKTLDATKTAIDATTDIDDESDFISDGLVGKTGTLNGMDTNDSPTVALKAQFYHTITATAGGEGEADALVETEISTPKQLIMINWSGRAPVEGEPLDVDIMPVLFTSASQGASYGGVKSLNFNFQVVSDDGEGCKPTHYTGLFRDVAA